MKTFLDYLSPILVFGIVIFVHELGHFLAAKSVGVYTPRFSIGFGPALWRRRRGETEYILAAFPLGGYVRMASRLDESTAGMEGGSEEGTARKAEDDPDYDPEAMIPFGPKPVPEHRWFESKPLWARLYILVAGVTMNFVLGLIVAIVMVVGYGKVVNPSRVVGLVRPIDGKAVLDAVVQPGDTLKHVNGAPVVSWTSAMDSIVASSDSVTIGTNRGTVLVHVNGAGQPTSRNVAEAIDYHVPPVFGELLPGEVADRAGFKPGDTVVTIDGAPVASFQALSLVVSNSPDKQLRFDIRRAGTPMTIVATPKPMQSVHPVTREPGQFGKLGVYPAPIAAGHEPLPFGAAVAHGTREAANMGTAIVGIVRDLFLRRVSVDQLGGPLAIIQASVQASQAGLEYLLNLIALLSINVGILNLLPIPILDGGGIVINVLESARGKAFSLRTREYILRGGLFVILMLFALVMFNDTMRFFR